jgi:DNA-binding HxlR family transcriptional regulator
MTTINTKAVTSQFTMRIVRALQRGPLRFSALERASDAPNPVRLSHHLKKLARDGILTRRVIKLGPPAVVEYALTELGADLAAPASALLAWTETHADQVQASRDYHQSLAAQQ